MTTTITDFASRVRKGIAAIEEYEPGATDRIDLETLDLYNLSRCATAQSVGDGGFGLGLERLGIRFDDDAAAPYGFSITYAEQDDHTKNYENLRQAWINELTVHRTAKAALVAD